MAPTLLTLSLLVLLPTAPPAAPDSPRKPNPLAPSLPLLTDAEEDKLDQIIDRFIQFDIGKLKGEEGKRALEEFQKLGPEAIPALIRGLNRAALIDASCPAVIIGKKLRTLLGASKDVKLLEFARDNIGAGVTESRHLTLLKDLRFACLLRKNALVKSASSSRSKPLNEMSVTELTAAAGSAQGSRLKEILTEVGKRSDTGAIATLGIFAGISYDEEAQQLARDLLLRYLSRASGLVVKDRLKDDRPEVRAAAAKVVGNKRWRLGKELIDLLEDSDADVRQAARQALVQISRGTDHGPERDAGEADRAEAVRKWRDWWTRQGGK